MKRFFQITIIVVLALALALTIFAFTETGSEMADGKICPSVGWNTRSGSCSLTALPLPSLRGLAYQLPLDDMPNVGWNT